MIYNVICEISDANTAGNFEARLKAICKETCQYASNAWFVDFDGERKDIFSSLRESLTENDTLVVSNIDFNNMAGWLPGNVIDWIKKKIQTNDK